MTTAVQDTLTAPDAPPEDWFTEPEMTEPQPLTVEDNGYVHGLIAAWGTCHTGYGDQCVTPPHSQTDYAYFRTGAVRTAEGTQIPTGRITVNTGHAGMAMSASQAAAHYDHTGAAVADVVAGENEYGIWVAGAVRPGTTAEQVAVLRASPPSGDWRTVRGSLELVGVLGVNTPGFPVPRKLALAASGAPAALVAGMDNAEPEVTRLPEPCTSCDEAAALLAELQATVIAELHSEVTAAGQADLLAELTAAARHDIWQWLKSGEGAARVRWGTTGSWTRCFKMLADEPGVGPEKAKRLCATAHHQVEGKWPGEGR